ncbi:MAG: hypothetical protein AAFQ87_13165 [Bacteroidota bacterium]
MKAIYLVFTLAFMGLFVSVQAQAPVTPKVSKTQVQQQKRIKQGVQSGELTRRETAQLQRQQRHIQRTKRRAKADGTVTPRERVIINSKQKRASANIARQKRDAQDRN